MESLKKAAQAVLETAEGPQAERVRFLEGLWEVQRAVPVADTGYEPADTTSAEEALVSGQTLFMLRPPTIDEAAYADMVRRIADYIAETPGLPEEQKSALATTDFAPAVAEHFEHAATRPAEFIGVVTESMAGEGADLSPATIAYVLQAALVPFLSGPAGAATKALGKVQWQVWDSGDCPVCGSPAAMGRMGESTPTQGADRTLWCSTCDSKWGFDRLRCARCGSRHADGLRYTFTDDDPAHRAHVCDDCGSYLKVVFAGELGRPLAFPVEDAVSAELDAAVRAEGYLPAPGAADEEPQES
jgi:FdhE protein